MEFMDILFIVIGLVLVLISFFLSERLTDGGKKEEQILAELKEKLLSEIGKQENKEQLLMDLSSEFSEKIRTQSEELLLEKEDAFSRLANEKMLSFGEYSDQILEKIHQDHTEVVFLYDMLKEKESMLKDFSARVDGIRVQAQSLMNQVEQAQADLASSQDRFKRSMEAPTSALESLMAASQKARADQSARTSQAEDVSEKMTVQSDAMTEKQTVSVAVSKDMVQENSADEASRTIKTAKSTKTIKSAKTSKKTSTQKKAPIKMAAPVDISFNGAGSDRNEQILQMHRDGMSVVDISRTLGIGQGEVKLIIDLFQS